MLKLYFVCIGFFGLVALHSGTALAQSTSTCMTMGPNMLHCDTMDMGSPASPTPIYPSNDGGELLGKGLHKLIFGDQEKAIRMKVGKLLADGDCNGAARVALESGRIELGQSIVASCHVRSASNNTSSSN